MRRARISSPEFRAPTPLFPGAPVPQELLTMFRRSLVLVPGLVMTLVSLAPPASAAPGVLDPTFGGDGRVTTDLTPGLDAAGPVVVQPDGKVVTAGANGSGEVAVVRYLEDGTPDPDFGGGDGIVTTDITAGVDGAGALVLQPDGKLVAAGGAGSFPAVDFALVRYLEDGTPDPDFGGGDGIVTTDVSGAGLTDFAQALALQPDGKLVAVGTAVVGGENVFATIRYLPGGGLDPDFGGGDGIVFTDIHDSSFARKVAVQPDAKLVVLGDSRIDVGSDIQWVVVRYLPGGAPDPDFGGGDGIVITDTPGSDNLTALALHPDGTIMVAGQSGFNIALARYTAAGSLDPGFGIGGILVVDLPTDSEQPTEMIRQPDGKLVLATDTQLIAGPSDFTVVRVLADGTLDPTFGTGGVATTDFFGFDDFASGVALTPDGRVVAAGFAAGDLDFETGDIALARYGDAPVVEPPPPPPPPPGDDDDYDYQDDDSDFDFDTPFDNSADTGSTDTGADPGQQVAGDGDGDGQAPGAPAAPGAVPGDTAAPTPDAAPQAVNELPRTGLGTISTTTRAGVALIALGALAIVTGRRRKAAQA